MTETRCGHTGCPEQALALSDFCWDHLPDREQYVASLVKAANAGQDLSGANLKKITLTKALIEKALLTNANLAQADLSETHFFDCALSGADLIGADLSDCDLTHCDLSGADLTKARLVNTRLWNSVLANANLTECDLSRADLWNANLYNVKLWHTGLTGAKSITRMSFSPGGRVFENPLINESGKLSAEESYRDLKRYFLDGGMYNDASWASFKEKSMERLVLKQNGSWMYIPSMVMNILCGYGEKPYRIVLSAAAAIAFFALLYGVLGSVERPCNPSYVMRWYDYIYYSTITFTTVGYGDFVPKQAGVLKLLAAFEGFCGVFMTGLFIFTLARKYSAR